MRKEQVKQIEHVLLNHHCFRFSYRQVSTNSQIENCHQHRGLEFNYIHEGCGTTILNGQQYELRPNLLICCKPFQLHRIHAKASVERPYIRTTILFEPTSFDDYFKLFPQLSFYLRQLLSKESSPQVLAFESGCKVLATLLEHYSHRLGTISDHESRSTFGLFLTQFMDYVFHYTKQEFAVKSTFEDHCPRYSESIMRWIENHYSEEFNLDKLAKELHLSKHYVSRVFRQETGSTITDYLTGRRLRHACWLLSTTDLSVQNVSIRAGFASFAHFCHVFKRSKGETPLQYKRRVRKVV